MEIRMLGPKDAAVYKKLRLEALKVGGIYYDEDLMVFTL
ncbi:hypothetical protein J2S74_000011 [Evansella vedderi]|uniref:GNAT family N-acetyltransferase n=1 Tax=Evansella vedderi TaxID=38282 RepID=A0ABT9ZP64_9BACI|nr:hypothetical protein [Evansella vedderi]